MASLLSKIYHTAGKVINTGANLSPSKGFGVPGAAFAASSGKVGYDPTPGYSLTNNLRSIGNSAAKAPAQKPAVTGLNTGSGGYNPYGGVGGGAYGSGGYGSTAQTAQEQALLGNLRNQVVDRIKGIQQAYDQLNQGLDASVSDRSNQLNQNYGTQTDQLNNTYKDTSNQLYGQYGNRGLGDSSFSANAQDSAANTYNTNLTAINQEKASKQAELGQIAATGHAQYNQGKNSYNDYLNNLGNYGASDLQSLVGTLGQTQSTLATQNAGQGTQAQYLAQLNAITPTQNQGTSQLAAQLQALSNSAVPNSAKTTIAKGLISQAGQGAQQDTWLKQLLPQAA